MRFLSVFLVFIGFLGAQSSSINSISSDFTQIITSAENDTITYKGDFQAVSEGANSFALWSYKTPVIKKIYFANSEVVIIEPDLEQVIVTSIEEMPDISAILSKAANSNKQTNTDVTIDILDVKYKISFKDNTPTKISYTDKLDNEIVILLKNTLLNVNISKLTFQVEVPDGFDIVRY